MTASGHTTSRRLSHAGVHLPISNTKLTTAPLNVSNALPVRSMDAYCGKSSAPIRTALRMRYRVHTPGRGDRRLLSIRQNGSRARPSSDAQRGQPRLCHAVRRRESRAAILHPPLRWRGVWPARDRAGSCAGRRSGCRRERRAPKARGGLGRCRWSRSGSARSPTAPRPSLRFESSW